MADKSSPEITSDPSEISELDKIFEAYQTIVRQEACSDKVHDLIRRYRALGLSSGELYLLLKGDLEAQQISHQLWPISLSIEQFMSYLPFVEEKLKSIYLEASELNKIETENIILDLTNHVMNLRLLMSRFRNLTFIKNLTPAQDTLNELHNFSIMSISCSKTMKILHESTYVYKQKSIIGRKPLSRIFLCQETINFSPKLLVNHLINNNLLKIGDDPYKFMNKFRHRYSIDERVYFEKIDIFYIEK